MAKIIDLSKPIRYDKNDPWWMRAKVHHTGHAAGGRQIRLMLGLPRRLFRKGFLGWANDTLKIGVHSSTHLDAPWHYHPTTAGEPAKTIDQIPLDWCYGPGVVVDVTDLDDYQMITVDDIEKRLEASGAKIEPGTIVLIKTGRDKYSGTPEYLIRGVGMSAEATEWLIDRGVKIMGVDQWGFDLPLQYMADQAKKTGDPNYFWQAHLVGMEREYCHIEQLTGLDQLPHFGFKVAVFPLKIVGASAGPARVVALFDEEEK